MDKEELQHALRRAEIMTSDKSNSVKMTFSENNLTITSNSPEVGESRETMAINYKGEEVSIACLLYTSPSPRDKRQSRMPSSA